MSQPAPHLLVQLPVSSWRAIWVGVPSGATKIATFSIVASSAPSAQTAYPSVANARMKLASVSSRGTPCGQYASGGSAGHHQRLASPAAQAIQLYRLLFSLVSRNPPSRSRGYLTRTHRSQSVGIRSKVSSRLSPTQPRLRHSFEITRILWCNGIFFGDCIQRIEPMIFRLLKIAQDQWHYRLPHADDALIGLMREHFCRG